MNKKIASLFALFFLAPLGASAAVTPNGLGVSNSVSGTSVSVTLAATATSTNAVSVCYVYDITGNTLTGVSGATSGAFTQKLAFNAEAARWTYFYLMVNPPSSETVTASASGTSAMHLLCQSFIGVDPAAPWSDTNTATTTATSITTLPPVSVANSLAVFGVSLAAGGNSFAGNNLATSSRMSSSAGSAFYYGTKYGTPPGVDSYTALRSVSGDIFMVGGNLNPYVAPVPVPDPIGDMIMAEEAGFASTTGFAVNAVINWSADNLIKLFIGSFVGVLFYLRFWIAALAIIGAVIFFSYKAFKFFRH